jgi:hypothetical protein
MRQQTLEEGAYQATSYSDAVSNTQSQAKPIISPGFPYL